jgi:hypothetical protein
MKPKYLPMAVTALGNGVLHRAIVSLPEHMTERDHPMQERIVFFETPSSDTCARHLEQLLVSTRRSGARTATSTMSIRPTT